MTYLAPLLSLLRSIKMELSFVFFQSISQLCYRFLTFAFIVLQEEVKRSELWKLTCWECKVIRSEPLNEKQKKENKNKQEKRTDCTGVLLLLLNKWSYYLEMPSIRIPKTCQKCKTTACSPYLLLKIVLWLNPQGTTKAKQWTLHNEKLK